MFSVRYMRPIKYPWILILFVVIVYQNHICQRNLEFPVGFDQNYIFSTILHSLREDKSTKSASLSDFTLIMVVSTLVRPELSTDKWSKRLLQKQNNNVNLYFYTFIYLLIQLCILLIIMFLMHNVFHSLIIIRR